MQPTVYLSGPIKGLEYDGANKWRYIATCCLLPDIIGVSPLRGKEFLKDVGVITGFDGADPLSSSSGIMCRDFYDTRRCDAILVNLLGTTSVSVGTVMEVAWAFQLKKPVVLMIEPGNVHEHPMLYEAADYVVQDLDHALDILRSILLPYAGQVGE